MNPKVSHEQHDQLHLFTGEGSDLEPNRDSRLEEIDDFDRLHDQFNATEIAQMTGQTAISETITNPTRDQRSNRTRKVDRRTLSPSGKRIADDTEYSIRQRPQ
jgi:hypothetical protein